MRVPTRGRMADILDLAGQFFFSSIIRRFYLQLEVDIGGVSSIFFPNGLFLFR